MTVVLLGVNAFFGGILNLFRPKFNAFDVVSFKLHTKSNQVEGFPLALSTFQQNLIDSGFNNANPTRVVIHGWMRDSTSPYNEYILNAFFNRTEDFNMIVVDWGKVAKNINYVEAAVHVDEVGIVVARMLENLYDYGQVDLEEVTLIGHSLGAHVAGYAGRNLKDNLVLGSIVALDPANPLFGTTPLHLSPMSTKDANYVQSIQTSRGILGEYIPLGHATFYPNYGPAQPGCLDPTFLCNHMRSFFFYAESVATSTPFLARKCKDYYDDIARYRCTASGPNATMGGEPLDTSASGVYWLSTNSKSPFSLGVLGV